jgi:hypothetical protein
MENYANISLLPPKFIHRKLRTEIFSLFFSLARPVIAASVTEIEEFFHHEGYEHNKERPARL